MIGYAKCSIFRVFIKSQLYKPGCCRDGWRWANPGAGCFSAAGLSRQSSSMVVVELGFCLVFFWYFFLVLCCFRQFCKHHPTICGHLAASRRRLASRTTTSGQIMGARQSYLGLSGFRASGFLSFRALGCWGFGDLGLRVLRALSGLRL